MRVRMLAVTVLVVGAMAGIAVPGDRIILTHWWDHPCPNPQEPTCEEACGCEADWDVADNWFGDGYPSDPGDYALIRHSNTAYAYCVGGTSEGELCSEPGDCPDACAGGLDDGDPCTDDDDCHGECEGTGKPCLRDLDCSSEPEKGRGSCINKGTCSDEGTCKTESHLLIDLSEEDIYRLDIETRNTAVPDDELDIRFDGHWLTVGHLVIDATNGPVKVRIVEGTVLRTDPTD